MEEIGKILKERREQLNKSLEEIYNETKINTEFLKALEEENFTFLPETYVKAFLQTYAKSLGLNDTEILNKYLANQEEKRQAEEQEEEPLSGQSTSNDISTKKLEWVLGLGALLLLGSLIFVYIKYKAQIFEEPSTEVHEIPIEEFVVEENSVNGQSTTENRETFISPFELQIKAVEKVWLRVTIDNGKATEYILTPNNRIVLNAEQQFDILVGNAGGLIINFGGKEFEKLGDSGERMRLLFTKDGLIEKKKI
jgi:cytoskeletal protein RodZ